MFPCTSCGLCCQNISKIKELEKYDLGDGICKFFDKKNNICTIYKIRPDICKIDFMYKTKYYKYYKKKDFYLLNAEVCNMLQKKFNADKKYQIILGE